MLVTALLLLVHATPVWATGHAAPDTVAGTRPVVGLALGGGGARGFAHIGVLQRLEELRIPVDRIAGTSMGAIVGSLYALGLTADEIERVVLAIDWRELMIDRPPRAHLSYRRKTDDMQRVWPLELGFGEHGVEVQRSLVAGQNLAFAFAAPGLHVVGYEGFDHLPIPFRAAATDLLTGEPIVLDHGNLLRAVRASMSVPGAFPPVPVDGRLLVDGFLRRNLPVDVTRSMGAERVIGVHVAWGPGETTPADLESLPGVLLQANNVLTWGNEQPQLLAADVAITVPMPDLASYDFHLGAVAIAAGRAAVDAHLAALADLALTPAQYARWRAGVRRPPTAPAVVDRIELRNDSPVHDGTILARITQPVGEPLDLDRLARDLGRVYELGVYELVDFSLEPQGEQRALVIEPRAKPHLPWIIRFGGSYSISYQNRGRLDLVLRAVRLELNDLGGELRLDAGVGRTSGLAAEWYQPLERSRTFFVAPGADLRSTYEGVYADGYLLGHYTAKAWAVYLDAGANLGRFGEFRLGYRGGRARSQVADGLMPLPERDDRVGILRLALAGDTLDNHAMPHHGIGGALTARLAGLDHGDDVDFNQYLGHLLGAFSRERWIAQYRLQAGSSTGTVPYYRQYTMGGLRDLTGVADTSLRGNAFAMAGAGVLYRVRGLAVPYSSRWYLGLWGDAGNTWLRPEEARLDDLLIGGAATLLLETALGPVEFGYGYSSSARSSVYLQLGIHFASPLNN